VRSGRLESTLRDDWPQPESHADKRNETAAQDFAVALERAKIHAVQTRRRVDAKDDVGDDCAERPLR
jgi:hypothetical protein